MGKIHGKNADIWFGATALETDANTITLTISPDVAEVTSFGDMAKTNVEGLYGWTLDLDAFWNSAAGANDAILYQMIGGGGGEMKLFPQGSAASRIFYWGTVILNSYSPETSVDGPVTCTASFTGNGALSRGTASA